MFKRVFITVIFVMLFTSVSYAGDSEIKIKIDGSCIDLPDAKPYMNNDYRTMVPVRFVTEALGCEVKWNSLLHEVTINNSGNVVKFKTGENKAYINENEIVFDTKSTVKKNRTFIPLRFLSESLNYIVDWDGNKNTVLISTPLEFESGCSFQAKEALQNYTYKKKVIVENKSGTKEKPYIIEELNVGLSIHTDGIIIKNCNNIVIRDNYIHECMGSNYDENNFHEDGFALHIINCKNVTVSNNLILNNKAGIFIKNCDNVKVLNNTVKDQKYLAAIKLSNCKKFEIANNYVKDNGIPEIFYDPGYRIIGIYVTNYCIGGRIHHNKSIHNTSDGIAVYGQNYDGNDWTTYDSDIEVYSNYIKANMEQGLMVERARNVNFYNNEIIQVEHELGIGTGITFGIDVINAKIYNNRITARDDCQGGGGYVICHDIYFHDNILYTKDINTDIFVCCDGQHEDSEKAKDAGIEYRHSSGIIIENNHVLPILYN